MVLEDGLDVDVGVLELLSLLPLHLDELQASLGGAVVALAEGGLGAFYPWDVARVARYGWEFW